MASFLEVWLVKVIQAIEPFVSSSIESGARWDAAIASQLEETAEGIIIVTSRNQSEPWLNFEAGALAKATDSRVRPFLIDVTPTQVQGPISSFQATRASDKAAVLKMLRDINGRCERKLDDSILEQTFEREWPQLLEKLKEVIAIDEEAGGKARPPGRSTPEILSEVLDRVRVIERESLEQRFQIGAVVEELSGLVIRRAPINEDELKARDTWQFNRKRELQQERKAQEEARRAHNLLTGMTVVTQPYETSDGIQESIRGKVVAALTRGTGVYVRIETPDGAIRVVPLSKVTDIEGQNRQDKPDASS